MTILIKNSTVAGKVPLPGDLQIGELAMNSADGKLYMKTSAGVILEVTGQVPIPPPSSIALVGEGQVANSLAVYQWINSPAGFGTKFTNPSGFNFPSPGVAFSPNKKVIAIGDDGNPTGIRAHIWSTVTGFGTQYPNPPTAMPGQVRSIAWSPDGTQIAIGHRGGQGISVYAWDDVTGFGARYSGPSSGGTYNFPRVAWSPDGTQVGLASGFAHIWPFTNGVGFGTKYSVFGLTDTDGIAWSPDGTQLAIAGYGPPGVQVFPWTNGVGPGSPYASPSPTAGQARDVAWNNDGTRIVVGSETSPFIFTYPFTNGVGFSSIYANPSPIPSVISRTATFSPDGKNIFSSSYSSPYILAWPWTNASGYGTKFADPSVLPVEVPWSIAFTK